MEPWITQVSHIVERKTRLGWAIQDLNHTDRCALVYCFGGRGFYQIGERELVIEAGDLAFFPSNMRRSVRASDEGTYHFSSSVFQLMSPLGEASRELSRTWGGVKLRVPSDAPLRFGQLMSLWGSRRPGYKLRCQGILQDLLGEVMLLEHEKKKLEPIPHYSVLKQVMEAMGDLRVQRSVEAWAKDAGLSVSRFRSLFKEVSGFSPNRYQNHLKVERAKDLLSSGQCNVSEAAEELGFESVFYFSRLFKKMTGKNPMVYRN